MQKEGIAAKEEGVRERKEEEERKEEGRGTKYEKIEKTFCLFILTRHGTRTRGTVRIHFAALQFAFTELHSYSFVLFETSHFHCSR